MEWAHHKDDAGFDFDYPLGWKVATTDFPSCYVTSPDGLWIALIQPLPPRNGAPLADVIHEGQFPTNHLFPNGRAGDLVSNGPDEVEGKLTYLAADGSEGRAQLIYVDHGQIGVLWAIAAPTASFAAAQEPLGRIIRSQMQAQSKRTAPPPPVTVPPPVQYRPFLDPQRGSFTIDAPVGWKIAGGLNHPRLGDRRAWWEANSPDGIYILSDPTFPHSLCHMKGAADGTVVPVGAGGQFVTLKPGAESSADCYLRQVGPRRFPGFKVIGRRPRPDIVESLKPKLAAVGFRFGKGGDLSAVETILERQSPGPALVASLLTGSIFNGNYGVGTAFWDSNNILAVSPAHLAPIADAVRTRMTKSFQPTQAMTQIVQSDEAQIYANAQQDQAAQWNRFNFWQKQNDAQHAFGQSLVDNYWREQQTHDAMIRGWEQNQGIYDRLSEERRDATMDRVRVADDSGGLYYDAPAGSNYYWRDTQTGTIHGTETDQPPDNLNSYAGLRKM